MNLQNALKIFKIKNIPHDEKVLKDHYKNYCKLYHPDKYHGELPRGIIGFHEVNDAYECLKDAINLRNIKPNVSADVNPAHITKRRNVRRRTRQRVNQPPVNDTYSTTSSQTPLQFKRPRARKKVHHKRQNNETNSVDTESTIRASQSRKSRSSRTSRTSRPTTLL